MAMQRTEITTRRIERKWDFTTEDIEEQFRVMFGIPKGLANFKWHSDGSLTITVVEEFVEKDRG